MYVKYVQPVISLNSSSENEVFRNACRLFCNCASELTPVNAEVTLSLRNTQAKAICARLCPRLAAISFSRRIRLITSSFTSEVCKYPCGSAALEPAGIPER